MRKCKECGQNVDLKAGDEISPGTCIAPDYGEVELCRECFSKGWSEDPHEIVDSLNKDPGFQLGIASPIQRHDL